MFKGDNLSNTFSVLAITRQNTRDNASLTNIFKKRKDVAKLWIHQRTQKCSRIYDPPQNIQESDVTILSLSDSCCLKSWCDQKLLIPPSLRINLTLVHTNSYIFWRSWYFIFIYIFCREISESRAGRYWIVATSPLLLENLIKTE